MTKLIIILMAIVVTLTSAFAPVSTTTHLPSTITTPSFTLSPLSMAEDMTWGGPEDDDKEYPPSKVLGPIMSKMPSGVLGGLSALCLIACVVSVTQSSVLQQEAGAMSTGSWVKWYFILGSFGGPFAWGLHVASWIQRQNGM
eukprot:CAMPEP_0198250634 /NCGR_PEP_ID=MMETSP1447-20131203/1738_1 /TAXON_ID=420782 /ORGANISM="Chaetoceros dichaeta, Strain CCMP1751" /LENGTH=141 /DNA_ID=CAMNT_0043935481 /DNA_START=100 /DNA_END=525 /DNA_ORIENTATION=-